MHYFPPVVRFALSLLAQSLNGWSVWESRADNQSNPTVKEKKSPAISLYSWGPCTHIGPWRPWDTAKELWICSLNGDSIHRLHSTQKSNMHSVSLTCVNTQVQVKVQLPREAAIQVFCLTDVFLFRSPESWPQKTQNPTRADDDNKERNQLHEYIMLHFYSQAQGRFQYVADNVRKNSAA